ncbi:hypothetical protein PAMA_016939 [Pampus argenteus]
MLWPIAAASLCPVTNTGITSQACNCYGCEHTELDQHMKDGSELQFEAENTPSSSGVLLNHYTHYTRLPLPASPPPFFSSSP